MVSAAEQARAYEAAIRQPIVWQTQFADGSGPVYLEQKPLKIQTSPLDMTTHNVLAVVFAPDAIAHYKINLVSFSASQQAVVNLTRLSPDALMQMQRREDVTMLRVEPLRPQPSQNLSR